MMNRMTALLGAAAFVAASSAANATIVRVSETDFMASAGMITFDEKPQDTRNPVYGPGDYGGDAHAPTVSFGGWFLGQSLSTQPGIDCPGAAATACVVGTPTAALTLDAAAPYTFIINDGSTATTPVLSGSPTFEGPVAILFDKDLFGVSFDGGSFASAGSTAISAFDRAGNLLGSITNTGTGTEFFGLLSGGGDIAGIFLSSLTGGSDGNGGTAPDKFNIDNIRVAENGPEGGVGDGSEDTGVSPVPLPAAGWLLLGGIGALGIARHRRRS